MSYLMLYPLKISCEPTYKELKPQTDDCANTHHRSCEPTYKELKLQDYLLEQVFLLLLRAYL
mgnify:CR=1 FL=1